MKPVFAIFYPTILACASRKPYEYYSSDPLETEDLPSRNRSDWPETLREISHFLSHFGTEDSELGIQKCRSGIEFVMRFPVEHGLKHTRSRETVKLGEITTKLMQPHCRDGGREVPMYSMARDLGFYFSSRLADDSFCESFATVYKNVQSFVIGDMYYSPVSSNVHIKILFPVENKFLYRGLIRAVEHARDGTANPHLKGVYDHMKEEIEARDFEVSLELRYFIHNHDWDTTQQAYSLIQNALIEVCHRLISWEFDEEFLLREQWIPDLETDLFELTATAEAIIAGVLVAL